MPSLLARAFCYDSLGTAIQTPPEHEAELHCHHSSTAAACGSPSSISSCCGREAAPRPGMQRFCRGHWQTELPLPRKPSTFWRRRLQKHFNTAYANKTNVPLASFPLQAAAAQPGKLSTAPAQLSTCLPSILYGMGLCHSSREPAVWKPLP